jgi:ABC-2 type transport system permease protein
LPIFQQGGGFLLCYWLLASKTYQRNLQYRAAHLVSTLGGGIFGYIMIYIWTAASSTQGGVGLYSRQQLVLWTAFGQCLFALVNRKAGLEIQLSVRSGDVSLELLRPVDFFGYVICRSFGEHAYALIYRSLPLWLLYAVTVGYRIPTWSALLLLVPSLALALYVSLCLGYLEGIASFWTTDIRWVTYFNMVFLTAASGVQLPVDLLPGILGRIFPYLPWASFAHYPNLVYLGLQGAQALAIPATWAVILTIACRRATRLARRRLEVQGG